MPARNSVRMSVLPSLRWKVRSSMVFDYDDLVGGFVNSFIEHIPKAELHLHIEGTLEPEMMFELASRNRVRLPYKTPEEVRETYQFSDLQSFLDIYHQATRVLL